MNIKTAMELKVEASKFENVSSDQLVSLFKNSHIYFPDFINRFVLQNALKKYIFEESSFSKYSQELQYKLRNYSFFSCFLLEKMVMNYNYHVSAKEYKNLIMRFYFLNEKKFKNNQTFEETLKKLEGTKPRKEESFLDCYNNFKQLFYTPKGYLDGLNLSILKEAIVSTYQVSEIVELALNYNVTIPNRLNKSSLVEMISIKLKLNDDEKKDLETKSVTDICIYAKKKGFNITPELKKADMVEYILFSLQKYDEEIEKDLYNYDFITDDDDLIVQEKKVEEAPKVEKVEPVQEEKIEEVNKPQEKVEEAPKKTEEAPLEVVKEESKEVAIDASNEINNEIRDIIKTYYKKKMNQNKFYKFIIIVLSLALIAGIALFLLKYYQII